MTGNDSITGYLAGHRVEVRIQRTENNTIEITQRWDINGRIKECYGCYDEFKANEIYQWFLAKRFKSCSRATGGQDMAKVDRMHCGYRAPKGLLKYREVRAKAKAAAVAKAVKAASLAKQVEQVKKDTHPLTVNSNLVLEIARARLRKAAREAKAAG